MASRPARCGLRPRCRSTPASASSEPSNATAATAVAAVFHTEGLVSKRVSGVIRTAVPVVGSSSVSRSE